ncbi:hypothetical protein Sango_2921200 [Sesamum angolense]|uniref:Reverse transcriptase n=1 Tax=Sesamum angolense TaxID=2727404 RepID=A0AAE1T5N4_9LAMI|nr:hypothetical protein Sango_2921200 [Sesamum angolense]
MEYWTDEGLSTVASGVGTPLYTDGITKDCSRLDFARVCVMLDFNSTLPKHLVVISPVLRNGKEDPKRIDVEYEWLPQQCKNCCSLGHVSATCPANMKKTIALPITIFVQKQTPQKDLTQPEQRIKLTEGPQPIPSSGLEKQSTETAPQSAASTNSGSSGLNKGKDIVLHNSYSALATEAEAWDPLEVGVDILRVESQFVHCRAFNKRLHTRCLITVLYGDYDLIPRRNLWSALCNLSAVISDEPWLVLGDFNAVMDDSEVHGRAADTIVSMTEFRNCVRDSALSSYHLLVVHLPGTIAVKGREAYGSGWIECSQIQTGWILGRAPRTLVRYQAHRIILLLFLPAWTENLFGGPSLHRRIDLEFLRHELKHTITTAEASLLVTPVTLSEVKEAFFDIDIESAPGPDGYTSAFYRYAWPVIGQAMFQAVGEFFRTAGSSFVDRLLQNAFVPGRSITDNILLAQELLADSELKKQRFPVPLEVPLIDKVDARLAGWNNQALSYAGRLQLIKSVLSTLHMYWASAFILPKGVLKTLEKKMRQFLWQGSAGSRNAKVAWEWISKPKEEGGLGIRSLTTTNQALMLKQLWRILQNDGTSIWVDWIKRYRLRQSTIWTFNGALVSWSWKKRCSNCDLYFNKESPTNCVIQRHQWCWPASTDTDIISITSQLPPIHSSAADSISWRSSSGKFTFQAAVSLVQPTTPRVFWTYLWVKFRHIRRYTLGSTHQPQKSQLIISKAASGLRESLLAALGFQEGHLPVRYLGLPLIQHGFRLQIVNHCFRRLTAVLKGGEGVQLSFAGRVQLIKSVLTSFEVYWAMAFILPKGIIKEMIKRFRTFLWKGTSSSGYQTGSDIYLGSIGSSRFDFGTVQFGQLRKTKELGAGGKMLSLRHLLMSSISTFQVGHFTFRSVAPALDLSFPVSLGDLRASTGILDKLSTVIKEGQWNWPLITDIACVEITHVLPLFRRARTKLVGSRRMAPLTPPELMKSPHRVPRPGDSPKSIYPRELTESSNSMLSIFCLIASIAFLAIVELGRINHGLTIMAEFAFCARMEFLRHMTTFSSHALIPTVARQYQTADPTSIAPPRLGTRFQWAASRWRGKHVVNAAFRSLLASLVYHI